MKIFLLKALLLLLFLILLFLILRVLEGVAWYETGLVISQIVDPLSLSVRKLKVLLDGRGISYGGVVEKQELTSLLQASGEIVRLTQCTTLILIYYYLIILYSSSAKYEKLLSSEKNYPAY